MNSRKQTFIFAGILLLLVGLELRAVETIVLRTETTRLLAGITGPDPHSPQGAVRQYVVENTPIKKVLTPPNWLGWSMISAGVVVIVFALRKL